MGILRRITKRAWRYRTRMVLAYVSFLAAIAFSLLIPYLFGEAIDRLVAVEDGKLLPTEIERGTLIVLGLALLGASMMRGVIAPRRAGVLGQTYNRLSAPADRVGTQVTGAEASEAY